MFMLNAILFEFNKKKQENYSLLPYFNSNAAPDGLSDTFQISTKLSTSMTNKGETNFKKSH